MSLLGIRAGCLGRYFCGHEGNKHSPLTGSPLLLALRVLCALVGSLPEQAVMAPAAPLQPCPALQNSEDVYPSDGEMKTLNQLSGTQEASLMESGPPGIGSSERLRAILGQVEGRSRLGGMRQATTT